MGLLEKNFDFTKEETIELDRKKRKFQKDTKSLQNLWRKILKYETLGRLYTLKDQAEDEKKAFEEEKKDKKKGKKKKVSSKEKEDEKPLWTLSEAELLKKSREELKKDYKKYFARIRKEKRKDLLDRFYNSILKIYDPHTSYLIPDNHEDFNIRISGKLEGIGALLSEDGAYIKVQRVIPGSPSYKQGELEAEDKITMVGQGDEKAVSIVGMDIQDAVKLIRGPKGSTVKLTVKKPDGSSKVIPIIRDVVEIEETYAKSSVLELKGSDKKIGYIYLPSFYRDFSNPNGRNCSEDTRKAIKSLKKKGIDGLILDLRNNGGGALEDARQISGLFIKEGPIVQVRSSTGEKEVLRDNDSSIEFEKPLIVLVNRYSASASEIVAAALQDYKRAIIIGGEHTHGKGTVQAVLDLDRNSYSQVLSADDRPSLGALKLTIQKFYRVNGISTQKLGVTPDIILPDQFAHLESGERYLDYALAAGRIEAVPHRKLSENSSAIRKLRTESTKRVKKSDRFKVLGEKITWLKERKDKQLKSINLNSYNKEREELKKASDKFDDDKENENILVSSVKKSKGDVEKDKFEEFKKSLRKDTYLEEILHIMNDYIQLETKS